MEVDIIKNKEDLKSEVEMINTICRCCLSKNRIGNNIMSYSALFLDLAGITVTESDGLPQWLCWECTALLHKAVRFKQKLQRSHMLLYEYVTRCAPFPIDGQDPELTKYESPQLCSTTTLVFDNDGRSKTGYHRVLEHAKKIVKPVLDAITVIDKSEGNVKEEVYFSDFEDDLTLDEYRSNVTKLKDVNGILLEDGTSSPTVQKRKRTKAKENKVRKKKKVTEITEVKIEDTAEKRPRKTSIRKSLELDPSKIRIVILNPEEQIKMKEEESKASDKFPFQCNLCFKGFNFESKLDNHMFKHSPSRGTFECSLCHMYLPSAYSASVHALIHTRRYECLECGRRMIDRASILEHYSTQHEGVVKQYTCTQCGKVSNNKKTHHSHIRNHHSADRPRCDQCAKSFVNKDSLVEHMQIHEGVKNYACGECGARFRTRTQLKDHTRKHSDHRDFYCVECDTRFKSPSSLKQHLLKSRKHVDFQSLKFACVCCDKRFPTERALRHHSGVQHEGVRAHRCAQCPAALATRNSLSKHVRAVHAGARPPARHVCDTCGRAFRGKSVLMNHVRTHTGEKPFSCAECGRRFTQRTAMRTHTRLVHLKVRRNAKIKPEPEPAEDMQLKIADTYPKKENQQMKLAGALAKRESSLVFEDWQGPANSEVYFHVTAGP